MINVFRRGRIWWARGTLKGQPVYCSLDTQFRNVAMERAEELEHLQAEGLDHRPHRWQKFEREFLAWIEPHVAKSTWRTYRRVVVRFGRSLEKQGVVSLLHISASTIAQFITERMQDVHPKHGTKPGRGGLRSDLRILRRMFNYARQNKYIRENPVNYPRLNYFSTQTLPFTDDELALMFADPEVREKPNLRAVMLMLLYTGLRISDVAGMRRENIHFDSGRIEVKAQKNGAILSLPIHAELRPVLIEHLATPRDYESERKLASALRKQCKFAKARMLLRKADIDEARSKSPFVFPTDTGKYDHSLEAKLRRVWKRCGIVNAHAHRFRDTFSVKLLAQGASLYDVSRLLGNSVRVVERHYAPYVKELQERGARLVKDLKIVPADAERPGAQQEPAPAPAIAPIPSWKM